MLEQYILRTPLIRYETEAGEVYLKPENLQIFGSYKIRGIAAAIAAAPRARLERGLVTVSGGNMAQAVAFAAQKLNVSCRVFVPDTAPDVKKAAIRKLGAEITELPFNEIWDMVKSRNMEAYEGLFIHPVFTKNILQGYGTIGHEILQDLKDVDAVVIPFGVGGLTLGVSKALKAVNANIAIYAAEPATAAPLFPALEKGSPVRIEKLPSFIDAIGTPEVLPEVFAEAKKLVTGVIKITPETAKQALQKLLSDRKLLCEGAAGVSLAAAQQLSASGKYKKVVSILSGGNIPLRSLVD